MAEAALTLLTDAESTRSEALLNVLLEQQSQIVRLQATVAQHAERIAVLGAELAHLKGAPAAAEAARAALRHHQERRPAEEVVVAELVTKEGDKDKGGKLVLRRGVLGIQVEKSHLMQQNFHSSIWCRS